MRCSVAPAAAAASRSAPLVSTDRRRQQQRDGPRAPLRCKGEAQCARWLLALLVSAAVCLPACLYVCRDCFRFQDQGGFIKLPERLLPPAVPAEPAGGAESSGSIHRSCCSTGEDRELPESLIPAGEHSSTSEDVTILYYCGKIKDIQTTEAHVSQLEKRMTRKLIYLLFPPHIYDIFFS